MKIGICCYPSYGGSGVVATELGIHLAKLGHEVHFISYDKPFRLGGYHNNIYFHDVDVSSYPVFKHPPYIMSLANKIYEVCKYYDIEVLHAHYAVPHSTAVQLASQMLGGKVKTVTTFHGTDVTIMAEDPTLKDITEFSANSCDAITAVSEDLREYANSILNLNKPINRIYNFIDVKEYVRKDDKKLREFFNIKDGEKVIVHTSNFRPVKRIKDIINIFHGVSKEIDAKLLLIGDGPDQKMAHKMVTDYGIKDKVMFLGKQNSVIDILSLGDLFLLPSEKESFGLAALEAMACELPVIASRVGGLKELVEDGVTGFLSDLGDVDKMTFDALHLLKCDEKLKTFGKNARERAMKNFNSDVIVRQYEEFYRSLL